MEFRSVCDLGRTVAANLHRIPGNIDLIVGIPRSGLLAAIMLAMHTNLPLTDVAGLLAGRVLAPGRYRRAGTSSTELENCRRVLVIDDSVLTGDSMREVQATIARHDPSLPCVYAAVYGAGEKDHLCDLIFESCGVPRMFEWNFMHHSQLQYACVDIDGVLCVDPSEEENDDGPRYLKFLENAQSLYRPTRPIGALVSSRLEKYRGPTEAWLARHEVDYRELHLLDLPSKAARQRAGSHAEFKGAVYKQLAGTQVFIESEPWQAREIARLSHKPVICIRGFEFVPEALPWRALHLARNSVRRQIGNALRRVGVLST